MTDPEQHHTVQRALLRGFEDKLRRVCVHQRDGRVAIASTKVVTRVEYFYAYIDPTGDLDLRVEKRMSGLIESSLPALSEQLHAQGSLTGQAKYDFDRYVSYAMARTRTVRNFMDQADALTRDHAILAEMIRQFGIAESELTPRIRRDLLTFGRGIMAVNAPHDRRRSRLRTFLSTADHLRTRLAGLQWRLVEIDEPVVTSDAAVATIPGFSKAGGLLPTGVPVVVPLSRRTIALAAPRGKLDRLLRADDLVRRSNGAIVEASYEECFHHPDDDWPSYLALASEPPVLPVKVVPATSKNRRTRGLDPKVDATAALRGQYSSPHLDPFTRRLLEELAEDL